MPPNTKTQTELTEPIIEVFHNPANVKILTVLNTAAGTPLTVTNIINQTNISKQAFYDNKDTLLNYNLIEEADKAGNASRYKVDMATEQMQAFMQLRDALIDA